MPSDIASTFSQMTAKIGSLADLNCIVLCLDAGGRITFLNPFGLHFFGYEKREIIGTLAVQTLFPENTDRNSNPLACIGIPPSGNEKIAHQTCECQRKRGERAWIAWSSQTVHHTAGDGAQVLCIGHDITEFIHRKNKPPIEKAQSTDPDQRQYQDLQALQARLEEEKQAHEKVKRALKESQNHYRLFSKAVTEGILFLEDDIALEVNEAFVDMAECPRNQIIGMAIMRRFISPPDIQRVKRITDSDDDYPFEAMACSTKGRLFPVELRCLAGNLAGRPCRVICVRDISHRKKTERQMIQSQKMEAIGTLASGLVHDFNNMLAGIQGNVDVIRHQISPNSPHQKGLDLISNIVERGAKLSGQLLGYARGGQSELTQIDLNRLIEDAIDMFGSASREVHIQTRLGIDTPCVTGDATQIEQVLLNLMINAVHAMPTGGRLTIETRPTVLTSDVKRPYEIIPGDYAMLVVQDTGHGMDQETQKKIFEPFFTTKPKGQGTGLGLASTYGIIKNHKGYIDVSSEPGVGSRFSVLLPASAKAKKTKPAETAAQDKEAPTILMVDDETDFLLLGGQMLSLLGYQSLTTDNCSEAITQFKHSADKVDLIIMDMIMPDGSVEDTIQKLRELDPKVPILLSSGHSQNGETGRRLMPYCDDFIQKPFRLALLSQKIKALLGTTDDEN